MNYNTLKIAVGFGLLIGFTNCKSTKTNAPTSTKAQASTATEERPNRQSKQGGGRKQPPTFANLIKEMDADQNGMLSKSEVKGPLKEGFDKIDTNNDGFVTKKEFDNAPKPKRNPRN